MAFAPNPNPGHSACKAGVLTTTLLGALAVDWVDLTPTAHPRPLLP